MRTKLIALTVVATLGIGMGQLAAAADGPRQLQGKIVHVEDGDTIALLDAAHQQHTIRLADIDAPETCHRQRDPGCRHKPGQPFGEKARQALSELVKGRVAVAECRGAVNPGKDDRLVCYVFLGAAGARADSVNHALVKQGLAWVEPRFARDASLFALHDEAHRKRLGLWSMPNPIEPRKWRTQCWANGDCPQ